ncbi:acyltransferase family protein [Streptomyces sp. NPDC006602]|uniref:acyltransferase family protein n=1 Tax=Streptomyces sp. NPDC006602 TaxID=3364751 RepID=UPI0036CADC1A
MKRLELLDYARLSAALCVLCFHYLYNGIENGKVTSIDHIPGISEWAMYGYLGVPFFFMISGYVIFFSAQGRSAAEFAVSRAIRLFPAFWAAVLLTSLVAVFWGVRSAGTSVHPAQVLANLTMVPRVAGEKYVDGVYWSLEFELAFYLLVFLFLLSGWRNHLERAFLLWPAMMLVVLLADLPKLLFFGGQFTFFAAGAAFAVLKRRASMSASMAVAVSAILCIETALAKLPILPANDGIQYSRQVIVMVILSFFAFFLFLNSGKGASLHLRGSRLAGNLSYPIYLLHAHIGYMALSRFATNENRIVTYFGVLIAVLFAAWALHRVVEVWCGPLWRALFTKSLGRVVATLRPDGAQRTLAVGDPTRH